MICGIGCDIVEVKRFEQKSLDSKYIERFFSGEEIKLAPENQLSVPLYYASRFAAKEAFSKALGTGVKGYPVKDVFVKKLPGGAPCLKVQGKALEIVQEKFGECNFFVTLSHEKNNAVAFVIIEKKEG